MKVRNTMKRVTGLLVAIVLLFTTVFTGSGGVVVSAEGQKAQTDSVEASKDVDAQSKAANANGMTGSNSTSNTDKSITNMYNVPVTYYDYLSDNELSKGRGSIETTDYGNSNVNGWITFTGFNKVLAQYYEDKGVDYPLYFGNLLGAGKSNGSPRGHEVDNHIKDLRAIYPNYEYKVNNSNYFDNSDRATSATGLVYNQLTESGDLQLREGVLAPFFDKDFLETEKYENSTYTLGQTFESRFPFREVDDNGVTYYEYDSNAGIDNIVHEAGTFIYRAGMDNGVKDGTAWFGLDTGSENKGYGFFPLNIAADGQGKLNFGFGARMDIDFNLPEGGVITNENGEEVPITFEFTGDDDIWIFFDGQLVLDMGGAHKKANGKIDFKTLTATVTSPTETINGDDTPYSCVPLKTVLGVDSAEELSPYNKHTMTIFYMERGMIESNLKLRFNMQPVEDELQVEKEVDTSNVNSALKNAVNTVDSFDVSLKFGDTVAANKDYKLTSGSTTETRRTDASGTFTLKDGEIATFKQFLSAKELIGAEEDLDSSYFDYTTSWKAIDVRNNNAVITSGTGVDASFTSTKEDQITPIINKLLYTNTINVQDMTITKKTVDKNGDAYADSDTQFKFQVLLDLGTKANRTETTTVDKVQEDYPNAIFFSNTKNWSEVYAYCWNESTGVKNTNWPGVAMEKVTVDGTEYYYINNIKNSDYDHIIFNNHSDSGKTADLELPKTSSDNNWYTGSAWNQLTDIQTTVTTLPSEEDYKAYDVIYTVNGSATEKTAQDGWITLKSGEKATIKGVPVNTKYKIKEDAVAGYVEKEVTINNAAATKGTDGYYSGTVASGKDVAINYTNRKDSTAVSLTAFKKLDDGAKMPADGTFSFILKGTSDNVKDYKQTITNEGNKINLPALSYNAEGTYVYTLTEDIPVTDKTYQYDKSEYEIAVTVGAVSDKDTSLEAKTTIIKKTKDSTGAEIEATKIDESDWSTKFGFNNYTNTTTLQVTKKLVDADGNELDSTSENWPSTASAENFTFTIKDKGGAAGANLTYKVGATSKTTDANGTFTLKANETAVFEKLIIGTEYVITEETPGAGYRFGEVVVDNGTPSTTNEANVTLAKGGNEIIVKNKVLADLTVTKNLVDADGTVLNASSANWPADAAEVVFTFEIQKYDDTNSKYVAYDGAIYTIDGKEPRSATAGRFELKAGQSAKFPNLVVGSKYKVVEVSSSNNGYTFNEITVNGNKVTATDQSTGEQTIKESSNAVVVKNRIPVALTVTKEVVDAEGRKLTDTSDKTFKFEVLMHNGTDYVPYANQSYAVAGKSAGTTDANGQFELTADQTAVFSNVAIGSKYKVREVSSSDGYAFKEVTVNGAAITGNNEQSTGEQTIKETGNAVVVKNTALADLQVTKKVVNGNNEAVTDTDTVFTFTIKKTSGQTLAATYTVGSETRTITDGKFTLKAGETAVFKDLEIGSTYEIGELTTDGYSFKEVAVNGTALANVNDQSTGSQTIKADTNTVVVTNTPIASLEVSKVLVKENGDVVATNEIPETAVFTFEIQKKTGDSYAAYTGATYTVDGGDAVTVGQDGRFTLKAGKTAIFTNLEAGTKYVVKEVLTNGYTFKSVTVNGTAGTDSANQSTGDQTINKDSNTVEFTNIIALPDLVVTKKLVDTNGSDLAASAWPEDAADKAFTFKLQVYDAGNTAHPFGKEAYKLVKADGTEASMTTAEDGTFTLKVNEAAHFENWAKGTKYTVEEVSDGALADYRFKGITVNGEAVTGTDDQSTGVQTFKDGVNEVVINNTVLADLEVTKELVKEDGTELAAKDQPEGAADKAFTFEIQKYDGATGTYVANADLDYKVGEATSKTDKNGQFTLKPGETAVFADLEIGTRYVIKELTTDGYKFKEVTLNGSAVAADEQSTGSQSIQAGSNKVVFKNYPLSRIVIEKKGEDGKPLKGAEFKIEKYNEASKTWETVKELTNKTTGDDGVVAFEELHAGTYRITEVKTANNYVLLSKPIELTMPYTYKAGDIVNGEEVKTDGITYKVKLIVKNQQALNMPKSGQSGIAGGVTVGVMLVIIAIAGLGFLLMKNRRRGRVGVY